MSRHQLCHRDIAEHLLAEHLRHQGFPLLEDPLSCYGELCVSEGLIKSDGDAVTAVGDLKSKLFNGSSDPFSIFEKYEVLSLGGFFGTDKNWRATPPDITKLSVQIQDIHARPCLFVKDFDVRCQGVALRFRYYLISTLPYFACFFFLFRVSSKWVLGVNSIPNFVP
jgi:hypothetical protein